MKNVLFTFLLFFLFSSLSTLKADCVLNNANDLATTKQRVNGTLFGQSFRACETGVIEALTICSIDGAVIQLFLVKGDGRTIDRTVPYQTFTPKPNGVMQLDLTIPFPVMDGELISFAISGVDSIGFDNSPNNQPGVDSESSFFITAGGTYNPNTNSDLYFSVNNAGLPAPAVIPTLSQWGLLIFGLLVLNLSLFKLKGLKFLQKQTQGQPPSNQSGMGH